MTTNTNERFTLLPRSVRPSHYALTLTPDLQNATFTGDVSIDILVSEITNEVVLNAIELELGSATFTPRGGETSASTGITYNEDEETAAIRFGEPLPVGTGTLEISFTGILNDQLHGFYLSTFRDKDGVERRMAATQFEASDARRCFPCWDEPAIKATFQVDLIIPEGFSAISNTLESAPAPTDGGGQRVSFPTTPIMSTYLLAFIVGEMEFIEARSANGTLNRVWATVGQAELGQFALETSVRILDYYNDYFGVEYPLEKLDHIALPDFAAGAMENWGAVTYREVALLFDPASSSPGTRQRIVEIVAHEMAHMWFGDLVTMAWWNDLWLNESFASWMAAKAADTLFPDWAIWTQFIATDVAPGMSLDGLENSHPIESEVRNPNEVSQLFDAISYEKGASILRMLEQHIGPDDFRSGLGNYMREFAYSNAEGADLWRAMGDASKQDIPGMMDSWVKQVGYPVVTAETTRGDSGAAVSLTQRRFLYSGPNEDETLWHVPVRITTQGSDVESRALFTGRSESIDVPAVSGDGWIKVNAGGTGFYRVGYQQDELDRLIAAVRTGELFAPDRLTLLEDTYALARARHIPARNYLELAQAYADDEDYSIWAAMASQLGAIEALSRNEPYLERYQEFARGLTQTVAGKVGWEQPENEAHLRTLLRAVALSAAGGFGDEAVLSEAAARFARFLEDESSLRPDLRALVYNLSAEQGNDETFETMKRLEREFDLQEEKVRMQMALTQFSQAELLQQALDMSVDQDQIRVQDAPRILMGVGGNLRGLNLTWEFMKSNWPELERRYAGGGFAIMRLVSITGAFASEEAAQDVRSFFEEHPTPAATRAIQQSLERIELNRLWLERNRDELAEWLA